MENEKEMNEKFQGKNVKKTKDWKISENKKSKNKNEWRSSGEKM